MENKNKAFSLMLRDAILRLEGKDPEDTAKMAGIEYDRQNNIFRFSSLGQEYTLSYPAYTFSPEPEEWHRLTILHYLDLADHSPLSGEFISFSQIKDGIIRGSGFDKKCETQTPNILKGLSEEDIKGLLLSLGGTYIKTNADYSAVLSFMPYYPVLIKIWFEDDEFPAVAKMMVDKNDRYLSIEDAVTVGEIILEKLRQK